MRFIAAVLFGGMLLLSGAARAEIVVIVSQSQQQLAVTVDGREIYRWKVSTGRRGYETPDGVFHAKSLNREWFSRQYDMTPMPWSVFFYQGYALHGTTEARNLGHPASHGCVRLDIDNAALLFALVSEQGIENTKVMITERALPPLRKAAPALIAEIERGAQAWIAAQTVQAGDDEPQIAKTQAADEPPAAANSVSAAQPKTADTPPADAAPQLAALRPVVTAQAASPPVVPPATLAIQDAKPAQPVRLDMPSSAPIPQEKQPPQPVPQIVQPPEAPQVEADRQDVPLPAPRAAPDKRLRGETSYANARGDEAEVLRDRAAWLRQLAHKYGYEQW